MSKRQERHVSLVLDTHILLHYRAIDEVDWLELAQARAVTLVVPIAVIHELDEKKFERRTAQRASAVIAKLEAISSGKSTLRAGVTLRIEVEQPPVSILSPSATETSRDDQILATAKALSETGEVSIISTDLAMRVRAKAYGILTLSLPDDLQNPLPLDEADKEAARLRRELATERDKRPSLGVVAVCVGVEPGSSAGPPAISLVADSEFGDLPTPTQLVESLKLIGHRHMDRSGKYPGAVADYGSRAAADRYNRELQKYYDSYDEFYTKRREQHDVLRRSIEFDLWILNQGKGPARSVFLSIEFPTPVESVIDVDGDSSEAWHQRLQPPTPPAPPGARGVEAYVAKEFLDHYALLDTAMPSIRSIHDPVSSLEIREGNGGVELRCELGRVSHAQPVRVASCALRFVNGQIPPQLDCAARFQCDELVDPQAARLTFRITPASDPPAC